MTDREDSAVRADAESAAVEELQATAPPVDDEPGAFTPSRGGCRTELRGWAGAHLHGAVRPRRRAVGRGRPPGRWC